MTHSRRQFLIGTTAAATAALAGCVDGLSPGDSGGSGNDEAPCDPLDLELVDDPPHEPEKPPRPDDFSADDDWNDHYLGDGIGNSTEVAFESLPVRPSGRVFDDIEAVSSLFHAQLITSRAAFDSQVELPGDHSADDIDFDEQAVIVVSSGFGSSSVHHQWIRVDDNCEQYHLHGYYTAPLIQTRDISSRHSGVVVDRPAEYDLSEVWVSLTVDTTNRVNFSTSQDVQRVDLTDDSDDDDSDGVGPIDAVSTVPATRDSAGDWWTDGTERTGVVVHLDSAEEVTSLVEATEDVDHFLAETNFDDDSVFYLESAGPNACYQAIEVSDVVALAGTQEYQVTGDVAAIDTGYGACAEVITFPGILLRVESEIDFATGQFQITDGWGSQQHVEAISLAEFAQES